MNVKKWLTEEEQKDYEAARKFQMEGVTEIYDTLAAERELSETRRALMKKHEWADWCLFRSRRKCPECGRLRSQDHAPDCAIATALKGVGE